MAAWSFRAPPLVRLGWGAFAETIGDVLSECGIRRPMLVTDAVVGRLASVCRALATTEFAGRFDDIPGEPYTREIQAGLAAVRACGADGLVAVGGGSAIDTAKGIGMMATNGGRVPDYMGTNKFAHAGLPVIAVPTTAGTGSEVTRFTIITDPDTHVKMLITDDKMIPRAAIVDAALTVECPTRVTASAGVDALTHAIEAYVSRRQNPLSDALALSAIRRLVWSLPAAFDDGTNVAAREAAAVGALEAGLAFSNSSVALVHGMSRPLGAVWGIPHGIANSMLLPTVMEFSLSAAAARYRDVAEALGVDVDELADDRAATRGLEMVAGLCRALQIPSLGGYGVDRADLERNAPKMAIDALASGSPGNNPRVPTAEEIVGLYLRAH